MIALTKLKMFHHISYSESYEVLRVIEDTICNLAKEKMD